MQFTPILCQVYENRLFKDFKKHIFWAYNSKRRKFIIQVVAYRIIIYCKMAHL